MTTTFVIRIEPGQLTSPDLDLRYLLPDAIVAQSGGSIRDDSYDYEQGDEPAMLLFLLAPDETALASIIEVLREQRILGNDLSALPVAIREGNACRYVYPERILGGQFELEQ